ncbi:MAG: HAD-IA family hydrolase [Coriobacteriia bacterium]|nr:HAD-IA family hydrolase [Coriobacteriia bacterium]
MPLKAICFDVGNTLLYPYPSVPHVVREVLIEEGHCHDVGAIDALMPLVDAYYEDRYRSDDTFWTNEAETSDVWIGMYSLLCRRLGIEDDAERIAARVYDEFGCASRWRAYDDVAPAMERLVSRGVQVGIISNWDRRLAGLLDGLGLGGYLSTVISSAAVGLHKPNPRIFELACERLGVSPNDAAHVGDHHYADVVGASAVGMSAVLIDRHDGPREYDGLFLRTLDDLERVLDMEV